MAHYIDPDRRIRFVRAKGDLESIKESKTVTKLDGKEIADFYRSLINEESTSEQAQETSAGKKSEKKGKKKKSKMKVVDDLITDRDQRLWFKVAAENDLKAVKDYLKRGIDINSRDFFGCTALICAVAKKAEDVIEFLMESGADWTLAGQNGLTALGLAKKRRFADIANFIESFESSATPEVAVEEASTSHFCEGCKEQFIDISAHQCSIVHIVNSSQQPREGYAYGIPMSNIGYQLLKDTGWTESRGLGKEGIGRKYPLKTILKRDRKGLGLEKQKAKVTHFEPKDTAAVKTVKKEKRSYFKALQEKKKRDKKIENDIRRALNDYS